MVALKEGAGGGQGDALGREAVIKILDDEGATYFNEYPTEEGWLFDFINRLAAML